MLIRSWEERKGTLPSQVEDLTTLTSRQEGGKKKGKTGRALGEKKNWGGSDLSIRHKSPSFLEGGEGDAAGKTKGATEASFPFSGKEGKEALSLPETEGLLL